MPHSAYLYGVIKQRQQWQSLTWSLVSPTLLNVMPKPFVCLRHLWEFLKEQREVGDVCQVDFKESVLVFFLETWGVIWLVTQKEKFWEEIELKHGMMVSWTLKTNVLLCTDKRYTIANRYNVRLMRSVHRNKALILSFCASPPTWE